MPSTGVKPKRQKSGGNPVKLTIDDALGRLEYGKFHTRLLLVAALAQTANCMQIMVGFFFPQKVQPQWKLSDVQTASVTAILFFGMSVGVLSVNFMKDSWGARITYLVSALITALFGFLGAASPNFPFLIAVRFMVGFGLGGSVAPWYYVAEFVPHQFRGQALLKLGLAWSLGSFMVPFLGFPILDGAGSWRLMLVVCSVPGVLAFVMGLVHLPESPRWLMQKGKNDAALQVLRDAAVINQQNPWAICPQSAHLMRGGKTKSRCKAIGRLFRKEWRRMILCLLPAFLVLDFLYYSYIQLIIMAISDSDGDEDVFSFIQLALNSSAEFVGIVAAICCIDRMGRVPTQSLGYLLAGIFIMSVCIGRHFEESQDEHTEYNYIFYLSFLARMFIMAATNVTWVHTVEILPKKIRSTFHLTARALASIGAGASAYHMVSPKEKFMIVGIVVGVLTLFLGLLTWTFPETKALALGNNMSRAFSRDGGFGSSDRDGDEKTALTDDATSATIASV